jgi:hypothetical protein
MVFLGPEQMTIVNTNSTIHSGLLVTDNGDDLDVDLELIGGRTLRMSTAGDELGTWPIEDCIIEPGNDGSFRLRVDGDETVFTPENLDSFAAFAALVSGRIPPPASPADPDDFGDTGGGAPADDPVAFLFGSARPPIPRPAPGEMSSDRPTSGEEALTGISPVDFESDTYDFDPRSDVELLDEITGEAETTGETEITAEAEITGDDEVVGDHTGLVDSAQLADRLGSTAHDVDVEADEFSEEDVDAELDEEATLRSRFGSSSVERLSSAIGAMADRHGDDEDYEIGPNTVAAEVLESQRTLRDHRLKKVVTASRLKSIGILASVVLVLGFLILLAPRAIDLVVAYEGGPELPPPLTVTETPVAAVPVASQPEGATIFQRPAYEFVARWDAAGAPINEVLELRRLPALGPFDRGLTPFLKLVGVVLPSGAIDEFSLVVDPSGPAEYDRIALQALGVAIAAVDPDLSPAGRASLLRQMGLDVRAPKLDGIDGRVESRGIVYTLFYDTDTTLLTLTVGPGS